MAELELFKKKVISYIDKASTGGVSLLPFLDESKIVILESEIKKQPNISAFFSGGFVECDRVRCIVSSYEVEKVDFKIIVFEIKYNKKFITLNHRSILGALMNIGIKRECIGDIVLNSQGDAYFACSKEMASYVRMNFTTIGKAVIELVETGEEIYHEKRYETKTHFISSLRLDVIIAAAYGLSRSEALQMIMEGLVFISHVLVQNPSHIVKLDEELSIRHKGRVRVSSIGNTKSGRLVVELSKRV